MVDWRAELLFAALVSAGMSEDPEVRKQSLEALDLPPVFSQFDAVANDYKMDIDEHDFLVGRLGIGLPQGVKTLLYNCGVTHFYTKGEAETVMNIPDYSDFNDWGRYFRKAKAAVTEAPTLNSYGNARYDVLYVAFHEAGHALSDCLDRKLDLEAYANALLTDVGSLSDSDWQNLEKLSSTRIHLLKRLNKELIDKGGVYYSAGRQIVMPHRHFLAVDIRNLIDQGPELKLYFRNLSQVPPISYYNLEQPRFSQHPALREAYDNDLNDLLAPPSSDSPILQQGSVNGKGYVKIFSKNDDGTFVPRKEVSHYLPDHWGGDTGNHYEEAFAEIFENVVRDKNSVTSLATYFPRLATHIGDIVTALDSIQNMQAIKSPQQKPDGRADYRQPALVAK